MTQPPDPNVPADLPPSWGPPASSYPPPAAGGYQPPSSYPPAAAGGYQPPSDYPPAAAGGYLPAPPLGSYGQDAQAGQPWANPQAAGLFPPGVELASTGRRIGGFFMEILLAIVTLGIGYFIWSLIVWARGQTPGKQVLKMRCYRVENQRVANWGWMLLRQVVGGIIYEFTFYIAFIVSGFMLVGRSDRRTIQDFIAGTVVLYDPNGVIR